MYIVAPISKLYQAGTFCFNPLGVVAGSTTLKTISSIGESFYKVLNLNAKEFVTSRYVILYSKRIRPKW